MTVALRIHGEMGGRVYTNNNSRGHIAEHLQPSVWTRVSFGNSNPTPNSDLAGNGGQYWVGSTHGGGHQHLTSYLPPEVVDNTAFSETLTRFSLYQKNSGFNYFSISSDFTYPQARFWHIQFRGDRLVVTACNYNTRVELGTRYNLPTEIWNTYWVYVRMSSPTTATSVPGDGAIRIYRVDPRGANASPLFSFDGSIGRSQSNGVADTTSIKNVTFQWDYANYTFLDDAVSFIPSIRFVSSTGTLPSLPYGSFIRYTDSSGNYIQAIVTTVYDTGVVNSKATAIVNVMHMNYYPSGGSVSRFDGLTWDGVTHPWGTGSVALTDELGNALGTGTFEYDRSTFPRSGVFMPVAKPVSTTTTTTMTPSSGVAADSHLLLDNFSTDANDSDYVIGDAVGEYWQGDFDDDTVAGDAKLAVSGTPEVLQVVGYHWSRLDGAGSNISGNVAPYTVVTGNAFSTRAESPAFLPAGGGTFSNKVIEYPKCATGVAGVTEDWTVANLNSSSFGVVVK